MQNKIASLLLIILGVLVGIPIGVIIINWGIAGSSFLEVKLIQILELLLTILIAVFVVYFINSLVNRDLKKRDILFDLINAFQDRIAEIFTLGNNYIKQPDLEKERTIKSSFKAARILLSVIKDIKKDELVEKILEDDRLVNHFLEFKISLTDSPFGEKQPAYSESDLKEFQHRYEILSGDLYRCKLKIYS